MGLPNGGLQPQGNSMADRQEPESAYELQPVDYVMSALENALHSGLTLEEVVELGNFACDQIGDWDYAISVMKHRNKQNDNPPSNSRRPR